MTTPFGSAVAPEVKMISTMSLAVAESVALARVGSVAELPSLVRARVPQLAEAPARDARVQRAVRQLDFVADDDQRAPRRSSRTFAEELGRGAVVDRHDDDAAQQAAPERDDPFGAVLAPEDHLVVLARPSGVESRRDVFVPPRGPRVCPAPRAEPIVVDEEGAGVGGEIGEEIEQRVAAHESAGRSDLAPRIRFRLIAYPR